MQCLSLERNVVRRRADRFFSADLEPTLNIFQLHFFHSGVVGIARYLRTQVGGQFFQFRQTLRFQAHNYPRFFSLALNFTRTGTFVGLLARKSTGVPSRFLNSTSVSLFTILCASNATLC